MKEHERAAIEKAEALTAELEKSPMLRKLREDEAAETLTRRTAAAAKIEDLKLDLEATGVIQREIDGMVERLAVMERERRELLEEIGQRRYTFAKERSGIDGEIRHEEQILLTCYDPAIDAGIEFFRNKLDELRGPGKISTNRLGAEDNIFTEVKTIRTESNVDAINAALRYCMAAIKSLEEMKLCPAVDLPGIETLKAGIPRIDVYKESVGERPMEKWPNPSFLARMANEFDERIGKLLAIRI